MKTIFLCSDSVTGICSAICDAWRAGLPEASVGIVFTEAYERELFCDYAEVTESVQKEQLVQNLILKHMGAAVFSRLLYALHSDQEDKGTVVLQTMLAAKALPDPKRIMEHLGHGAVMRTFALARAVGGEAHQYTGFLRFRELKNGILYSEINPKNAVLPCIAEHFENRFPLEHFIIRDTTHSVFLLHQAQTGCVLVHSDRVNTALLEEVSPGEGEFVRLWRGFRESISIKERENRLLQRSNLPLRYRGNMVDFD